MTVRGGFNWVQAMLEAKAAEQDASAHTLEGYARDLKDAGDWLERKTGRGFSASLELKHNDEGGWETAFVFETKGG